MAPPIHLGPFELLRPVGKGGMADVWRARHHTQAQAVAVKVLTGRRAREEAFIRALKNEIHSVARLHHPGIILLFDTGEVDAEAEARSGGKLTAGSPWFAMELASHGALSPKRLPLPWPTTRMLLLSLLDALAHAHARGVIHRDLKPGNILLCAPDDPRPGLKLTDFGIAQPLARVLNEHDDDARLSGTPRYMAPEQFQARWRDFGPWTDLYALGCIAYQLATGRTPFAGDPLKLAIAHCHDEPVPPVPVHPGYPANYAAWVLRLLEKETDRRFACAADAAWALLTQKAPGDDEEATIVAGWEQALRSFNRHGASATGSKAGGVPDKSGEHTGSAPSTMAAQQWEGFPKEGFAVVGPSGKVPRHPSGSDLDVEVLEQPADPTAADMADFSSSSDVPTVSRMREAPTHHARGLAQKFATGSKSESRSGLALDAALDAAHPPLDFASPDDVVTQTSMPNRPAVGSAAPAPRPAEDVLVTPARVASFADRIHDAVTAVKGAPPVAARSIETVSTAVQRPSESVFARAAGAGTGEPETATAVVEEEQLFPRIPADETLQRAAATKQMAEQRGQQGTAATDVPALHQTTFAAAVPWTELHALSAQEPTASGRRGVARAAPAPAAHRDESRLAARTPPPMPPTWRRPGPPSVLRHLLGAGLGLFGLRQIPLVDRDDERDLVWDTLRQIHVKRSPRVIVVRGAAGIGKTRLCEWLVERAAEVGAATALRAGHGPSGGPLDGLPGVVAVHGRCQGLTRKELRERLRTVVAHQGGVDRFEVLALAELLQPSSAPADDVSNPSAGAEPEERVLIGSAQERYALVTRYLIRVAKERPVMVWFDDVQWGADAIAFTAALLDSEAARDAPIFVLLSASNEELAERPDETRALLALEAHERAHRLNLERVPAAEHQQLVEELLGLETHLAQLVAQKSDGNPLYAVTLVGDFIARGALELSPRGFVLKPGEEAVLPATLHEVWRTRLLRLLQREPPSSQTALELGAVLGAASDDGEWEALCHEAGVRIAPELIDALLRARFIIVDQGGARYAHAMLRESTLRMARDAGRLAAHHQAAARMLAHRYGPRRRGIAERRAYHLVEGNDLVGALPVLALAVDEAAHSVGFAHAHALLDTMEKALDKLHAKETDPRRARAIAHRARLLNDEARYDEALQCCERVLRNSNEKGFAAVVPEVLLVRGHVSLMRARYAEAHGRYEEARDAAERAHDERMLLHSLVGIADASYYRGKLDDTAVVLSNALVIAQRRHDEAEAALCLWGVAYVALWQGHLDQARTQLLLQQKLARRAGSRVMIANGRNGLGDVDRLAGRYDDAEAHYQEAQRLFDALGSGRRRSARVNLAMNALARGDLDRANTLATLVLPELERAGERVLSSLCHGVLAAVAANRADWRRCDMHTEALNAPLRDTEMVDGEHALLAEQIGDHAELRGDPQRAAAAYEAAARQWRALGRVDRADDVTRALTRIRGAPLPRTPTPASSTGKKPR